LHSAALLCYDLPLCPDHHLVTSSGLLGWRFSIALQLLAWLTGTLPGPGRITHPLKNAHKSIIVTLLTSRRRRFETIIIGLAAGLSTIEIGYNFEYGPEFEIVMCEVLRTALADKFKLRHYRKFEAWFPFQKKMKRHRFWLSSCSCELSIPSKSSQIHNRRFHHMSREISIRRKSGTQKNQGRASDL
jgi:hypothetical protein